MIAILAAASNINLFSEKSITNSCIKFEHKIYYRVFRDNF